jgi:hypothetical protein
MMSVIPGKYKGKLALLSMLIHGVRPDQQAWLPIFSLCYFHHKKDSDALHSKNQAHTLEGIIIGQSATSTAILVCNPRNQSTMNWTAIVLILTASIFGLPNNKIQLQVICLPPLGQDGVY